MKLIDILNMISKGELKEGTKIKLEGNYWDLFCAETADTLYPEILDHLNKTVELIEPDHFADVGKMATEKIEELVADEINGKSLAEAISIIGGKLNEVIRRINNAR